MASPVINIRIGKDEKVRLKQAAKAAGYTLSGFLRYAARTEARRVLDVEQRRRSQDQQSPPPNAKAPV